MVKFHMDWKLFIATPKNFEKSSKMSHSNAHPRSASKYSWYMMKTIITVCSVLLYGSETWTLKKEDIKGSESCKIWLWRRMIQISRQEH